MRKLLLVAIVLVACGGCQRGADYERPLPEGAAALAEVPIAEWPALGLKQSDRQGLLDGIAASLRYLKTPTAARRYPVAGIGNQEVAEGLERFARILSEPIGEAELRSRLAAEFRLYRSVGWNGDGEVLFTGYYTPIFDASRSREGAFRHPLYRLPKDLVKGEGESPALRRRADGGTEPYPARAEIDGSGMLAGNELVYLADPVDAYVIQVQGSAKLRLRDGSLLEVGYAGDNGHPYVSAALALVADGHLRRSELNLSSFRAWLAANPRRIDEYLHRNPRYVFFTETKGGPFGSIGQQVVPDVSIATDKRIFPPGALCFVVTTVDERPYAAFRLDHDTGGAIRAPGRCDLYMGEGIEGERRAGRQLHEGRLYYLVAR